MARERREQTGGNEPQSYGSNGEWLTGRTGQTVEQTPERTSRHDEAFYDDRHQPAHTSPADAGGRVNDVQLAESDPTAKPSAGAEVIGTAARRVASDGDQRKSYWRDRDYK